MSKKYNEQDEPFKIIKINNKNNFKFFKKYQINTILNIFFLSLLPSIVSPGYIVGLSKKKFSIPSNIQVFVALGDLQASLLPVIQQNEASLYIYII